MEGSTTPISYTGEVTQTDYTRFIKEESGIWVGLEGCIQDLDDIASKVMSKALTAEEGLAQAETVAVTEGQVKSADIYNLRLLSKVQMLVRCWLYAGANIAGGGGRVTGLGGRPTMLVQMQEKGLALRASASARQGQRQQEGHAQEAAPCRRLLWPRWPRTSCSSELLAG